VHFAEDTVGRNQQEKYDAVIVSKFTEGDTIRRSQPSWSPTYDIVWQI